MRNLKYLTLTLILGLVLAGCGQGTNDAPKEEDPNLGAEYGNQQQDPEPENAEIEEEVKEEPKEEAKEDVIDVDVLESINLYFADDQLMEMYRVEAKVNYPKNEEGIKSALELWAAGPVDAGLYGLVPEELVTVQSVENVDGVAHVSFSSDLLEANVGSSGESMLITQIVMVVEQFGYDEIFILIEGEVDENFLGHVGLSKNEPLKVEKSPEDYKLYQQ